MTDNGTTIPRREVNDAVRLDAWRAVFEKTDRIISERPVGVQVVRADPQHMGALAGVPAWSDGETITFNGAFVDKTLKGKDPVEAVLALKGLNYHELSHILYTPRLTDELPRMLQKKIMETMDPTYWYAFNALEDQRIETWFSAVFGPSRRYFEATIMNWIVKDATVEAAPLVYGRKYLSAKIRVGAGTIFAAKHGEDLYNKMKIVIDKYLTVVLPAQSSLGYQLVLEFHGLLKQMAANCPLPALPIPDNGCQNGPNHGQPDRQDPTAVRAGRVTVRVQRQAADAAKDAIDKANADDKVAEAQVQQQKQDQANGGKPQGDPSKDGQPQGGQGQQSQPSPGNSQGKGKGQGSQGQGDGQGGGKSQSPSQGSGGQGAGGAGDMIVEVVPTSMKDLIDAAGDKADEIQEDPQVLKDIEATLDAVKATAMNGQIDAQGDIASGADNLVEAPEEARNAYRKIVGILRRIKTDMEPERLRQQRSGRIDARKYVQAQPHELDIFNAWDPGLEDAAEVEVVLLLDISGSMRGWMEKSCIALWTLKRAFDKLDIRTTALVYSGTHQVLFQPSSKAKPKIPMVHAGGGTDPTTAYEQAIMILAKSSATNKVVVNLTDGQWSNPEDHWKRIARTLHGMDVVTMVLGLNQAVSLYGKHYHKVGHDIAEVSQLPKAVTALVAGILRQASQRN